MKTIGLPMLVDFKDRFLDRFFGLTIATRMTLAYLPLAVIIVLISVYTLSSLNELGDISRSIVTGDMVVIEATESLAQKSRRTDAASMRAFIAMVQRLARLEVMDLDASPLTRLPGGIAIENVPETRLAQQQDIAFCLVDIGNFKAFNDRYGYARGNEVIKATGKILEAAIADHGTEDAFVGHIGGDDFAVILHPDRYGQVCQAIIEAFDRKSPTFYDPEDRDRGYVIAKTRQGNQEQFPLMTVSIAVVTNLSQKEISSVRVGEVAAELKEYAKTVPGSLFLVDRREQSSA